MKIIIGCDEVGTGVLAGPLFVCGVRAPEGWSLEGLKDSKKLTSKKRAIMADKLEKLISNNEITWALAGRPNTTIDQLGMAAALKDAYVEVFHQLHQPDSIIIVDGKLKFDNLGVDAYHLESIVKADNKVPQVMAASILAKVYRDGKMKLLHKDYPMYGWESNVGYGAASHLKALDQYGPCPLHRFSYYPIKKAGDLPIV
jgi:ribonuclease HII